MWNKETILPLHHTLFFPCSFLLVLFKQPAVRKLWGRQGHTRILYLSAPPPCLPRHAQYAGAPRAKADSGSRDLRNQMCVCPFHCSLTDAGMLSTLRRLSWLLGTWGTTGVIYKFILAGIMSYYAWMLYSFIWYLCCAFYYIQLCIMYNIMWRDPKSKKKETTKSC